MLIFGCGENREQNQEMQSSVKMSGHFSIEGMMCEKGCKSYIVNKVASLSGVNDCKIDFGLKTMTVEYHSSSITQDQIIKHVNSLNEGQYSAKLIEEKFLEEKL